MSAGLGRREGGDDGDGPEDREGDPPAKSVCRACSHKIVFASHRPAIRPWVLLRGRSEGCGSFRSKRERFAQAGAAAQVSRRGYGSGPLVPMTRMCSSP